MVDDDVSESDLCQSRVPDSQVASVASATLSKRGRRRCVGRSWVAELEGY